MYKILIIEDDEIIVQIVKRHLESWGYEVFQIEDFTHVIQEFVQKDPQLVLNIINLRLDITHLYYPAKNSFQKGRLKRREIFTELLLYTLTT